jgi:glycosyltransferase involved in cell wall biosynthesis
MAICAAFRNEATFTRWRLLANENEDIDVTLIGPKYWEDRTWTESAIVRPKHIKEERFRFIPINMKPLKWLRNGWLSWELLNLIKKYQPDLIYMIGFEIDNIVFEVGLYRLLFLKKTKIVAFTMRGLPLPLHIPHFRLRWSFAKKVFDAYMCHFPAGKMVLEQQGRFLKPIYLQTQIGVDADVFKPDIYLRQKVRESLGIKDEFVFGAACRMVIDKGIYDILDALPVEGKWKLIILGDGEELENFRDSVKKRNLQNYVITPGYVSMGQGVSGYMNAMDCFIHVPRTNLDRNFFDTFPLSVVQAMATRLPVIGSDSGGVPYQLGGKGIIIPERNIQSLHEAMVEVMNNQAIAQKIGSELYLHVQNAFEIKHLTKCFNIVMREILVNIYDSNHVDQASFAFNTQNLISQKELI